MGQIGVDVQPHIYRYLCALYLFYTSLWRVTKSNCWQNKSILILSSSSSKQSKNNDKNLQDDLTRNWNLKQLRIGIRTVSWQRLLFDADLIWTKLLPKCQLNYKVLRWEINFKCSFNGFAFKNT